MSHVILVAPTAFKGTIAPRRVAEALTAGLRRVVPTARVLACPVADGGDGLLDVILPREAFRERLQVTGPLGAPVTAELGWLDEETAIFESSGACGVSLVPAALLDPLRATSRGVGELIWEAAERGAKTVIVGLGGSATVDGGTGAARGLGWSLYVGRGGDPRGWRRPRPARPHRRGLGPPGPGGGAGGCHHAAGWFR